jgi:hypothetical protein
MNGTNKMFKPFGLLVGREQRQRADSRKQRVRTRAEGKGKDRVQSADSTRRKAVPRELRVQ